MAAFREIFEEYGGNYEETMGRFLGKEDLYIKFLNRFVDDPNKEKLETALEDKDLWTAFEAAHTLKGLCANMGLTPLYKAVCIITEPLRAGDADADYDRMYEKIQEEYQNVSELRARILEEV